MWQGMVGAFPWWYIVSVLESIQSIKIEARAVPVLFRPERP